MLHFRLINGNGGNLRFKKINGLLSTYINQIFKWNQLIEKKYCPL